MKWTCPICHRSFIQNNQHHSCNDKTLDIFLKGKSAHTLELLDHFIKEYSEQGNISIHPMKSMITISGKSGLAHITQL
ncbi:MAG: hypothetical protein ABIT58_01010, partial [Ferruginibacter sp.]